MENNPLVSILLNCHNSSKTILRAVTSVVDQTYKNWELIIWDDGSKDETVKIVKQNFNDQRIKIFQQEYNLGLGASRLKAIKKINGSLVSILDADDYYDKKKIFDQVNVFQKNHKLAICSTWSYFYDENNNLVSKFESKLSDQEIKKRLLFTNIFPHSSIMYSKKLALDAGWYSNYDYSQDYDLTLKLIKNSDLHLIRKNLTHITQPDTSMSKSKKYTFTRIKEYINILQNNLKTDDLQNEEKKIITNLITMNYLKLALVEINTGNFKSIFKIFFISIKNPLLLIFLINYKFFNNLSEKTVSD